MFNSNASSASDGATYVEDVFQTWLYAGTGVAQTITNGVDISGKGGMVWIKGRSAAEPSVVVDTARGASNALRTSSTAAQINNAGRVSAFTGSGFTVGTDGETNGSGTTYTSWTFREQPKFFDVVTYTGNGATGKVVNHSLGSVPGCIMIKRTDNTSAWAVYHRSLNGGSGPEDYKIFLDTDAAQASGAPYIISALDSTTFTLGGDGAGGGSTLTNVNGASYVAYVFAHNAGGFGLTGTDNVISCGSYAGNSSTTGPIVTLGYEPQWVMIKNITTGGGGYDWYIADNMRGIPMSGDTPMLEANLANAESGASQGHAIELTATGFQLKSPYGALNNTGNTYIYIAIRRGPMKVPTSGTTVFAPIQNTGGTPEYVTTFPVDASISTNAVGGGNRRFQSRLTGTGYLFTNTNVIEASSSGNVWDYQNGWGLNLANDPNYYSWDFKRAPGFFDEVCYTGTGANQNLAHNLAAVPELMIVKRRGAVAADWFVYHSALGPTNYINLNYDYYYFTAPNIWNDTAPTSSVFTVGTYSGVGANTGTYVAYLFATCAGVSKVGSYTGTATTQQIDCGFAAGARFVLIKRTDSTGDWYLYDSARGIVSGNDPYLFLNGTAAQVTSTDYVDTYAAGFELSSTAPAGLNASGGTYIFLAIA